MSGNTDIFDTSIIVDLFRRNPKVLEKLRFTENIYIPCIVLGELLYGAENSEQSDKHLKQINDFKKAIDVLPITADTASYCGKIKAELKKKGKPIPENDLWIAAITMQFKGRLITKEHHFEHIDDLQVQI